MSNKREELWRGIRSLIQSTSEEMTALTAPQPAPPEPARSAPERQTVLPFPRRPERAADAAPKPADGDEAAPAAPPPGERPQGPPPVVGTGIVIAPGLANPNARRGVCTYYYENANCWEIPQAYSNTGLHVCMMRECPVYELHRAMLERRFADRFRHLW